MIRFRRSLLESFIMGYMISIKMFLIWTDGSCLGNPGAGGWACIVRTPIEIEHYLYGSEMNTTNNRMELLAIIKGLEIVPIAQAVTIFTDSQYALKGATSYLRKWMADGWKNARGKQDIKNIDLWKQLWNVSQNKTIHYVWVKGHANHEMNEKVDQMARSAARANSNQS